MTRVAGAGPRRVRHGVRGRAGAGREVRGYQARGQGQGDRLGHGKKLHSTLTIIKLKLPSHKLLCL